MTTLKTPFVIGSYYRLTLNKPSNVTYINCACTFKGMERENEEVMLAVFTYHGDGEEICIDMDFIKDWTIVPFSYPE